MKSASPARQTGGADDSHFFETCHAVFCESSHNCFTRLVPGWIAAIARFNPVNWAASAGRAAIGSHPVWGTVGSYAGYLALALAVTAVAATQAFRTYQRSI